ncbi:MAG TPA: TetR/AcrR family transcriptional regulator [Kofleriaceae bacterium]|nr:TetR/AcrR family transcriptional regulator [Kofleriaceae bacterium]
MVAAARDLVLRQGYSATGVDQICRDAGVTKGAFFHHFESKDRLGEAILADWADFGMSAFIEARRGPARHALDPFHRFIDILIGFVRDLPPPVTCVVGIVAQEKATANPALREACGRHLDSWTTFVRQLLDEARAAQRPASDFDSEEVASLLNSVWQGSMLIAKARQDPGMIVRNLEHARAYVDGLFGGRARPPARPRRKSRR